MIFPPVTLSDTHEICMKKMYCKLELKWSENSPNHYGLEVHKFSPNTWHPYYPSFWLSSHLDNIKEQLWQIEVLYSNLRYRTFDNLKKISSFEIGSWWTTVQHYLNGIPFTIIFFSFIFQGLAYALKVFNYFFTAVFILEAGMKIAALGCGRYLNDR